MTLLPCILLQTKGDLWPPLSLSGIRTYSSLGKKGRSVIGLDHA